MRNPYSKLFGAFTVMSLAYLYVNRQKFRQLAEDLGLDVYVREAVEVGNDLFDEYAEKSVEENQYRKYVNTLLERIKTLEERADKR